VNDRQPVNDLYEALAYNAPGIVAHESALQEGELMQIDTGCIAAFTPGITCDIARAGNLKSMFFGGEGLFLATLGGHGTVLLQSLPFSRLAERVIQHAPSAGGSNQGEGSVLGGRGNRFGD
jgi:uncharacterized protein (AIM24 family)